MWRAKLSPALTSSIGRPRRSSFRSSSRSSRAQSRPTTRARMSRVTGFAAANSTASTRAFHSRQRNSGGRSASSRSKSGSGLDFRAIASEPVEPEGWAAGELARGAERDQAVEQAPAGAVAETRDGRRGGDRVVGEQRLDRALPSPWRAVLARRRRAGPPGATGPAPGRGRRAPPVRKLAPRASSSRPRPAAAAVPRPRRGARTARRRAAAAALASSRLLASAASAPKVASGSASARSAITASAAAAATTGAGRPRPPASRSAAASSAAFCGSIGACRSAATAARRLGRKGSPGPARMRNAA